MFSLLLFSLFLIILCFCGSLSQQSNIFDPRVYNYYFYVTTNPNIIQNNITTEEQAAEHWKEIGIFSGMQASGSFHVKQFLDNYPDLKKKYGTNYTAAIDYYLQKDGGYDKHMLGYTIGGAYGRYTLGNVTKGLYISGSLRMAAAIDSLVWNNTEFVNNWGHGRQLQYAIHNKSGACWNPTEAGTYNDWESNMTSSIILNVSTSVNEFNSAVFPAFWTEPNQESNKGQCVAVNRWKVSNYTMIKSIIFMNDENFSLNARYNVIQFNISAYIPYNMSYVHFESPTAYLPHPFNSFYGVSMTNHSLINYMVPSGGVVDIKGDIPVIIASNDSNYALGVIPQQMPAQYGLYNYILTDTPDSNSCSKWNVQYELYEVSATTWLNYTSYLCVGTLNDVKDCMINIMHFLPEN